MSKALAGSLDYSTTLAQVAKLAVPRLADWCVVEVEGEDRCVRPVEVACADPDKTSWAASWRATSCRPQRGACIRVLRDARSELLSEVSDEQLASVTCNPEQLEILRRIRPCSIVAVPLLFRGRAQGVLTLISAESKRRYALKDLALAEEVGRRAGLAVANSRLYETAQRAIRAREDILAVVSHDLRSPLSAITMSTELLARVVLPGDVGDRVRDKAQGIKRSAERMDCLIRDLLDAASIEAGRFPVTRALHDAQSIVEETIEMMRPLANERRLRLEKRVDGELPPILCDRERLLQVFSNLVGNAIKFTPNGGEVRIGARAEGGGARFTVEDSGVGIAAEALPRIFDRYWQASRAGRAGAGLGLYIVKGIVEAHGGSVWAESRLGIGSTFSFTIPGESES